MLAGGQFPPFPPMYTLEELKQKSLKELKEIGWQLNVFPEGDRRCRINWINALVGVQPPLLQLLETSPGVEVEPVQEAIEIQAQEPIEIQAQEPLLESPSGDLECPQCGAIHALYSTTDCLEKRVIRCLHCSYSRIKHYPGAIQFQAQEPIEIQRQEPIKNSPGVDRVQEPIEVQALEAIESKFGRIVYPKPATEPIAQNETRPDIDRDESAQSHNARPHPAQSDGDSSSIETEALEGKEGDRVLAEVGNGQAGRGRILPDQLYELIANFTEADQPPNRGDNGRDRLDSESIVSQSAIGRWGLEHPEIEISLESFCEWAPVPDDWYEPVASEPSEVLEVSPVSSDHCSDHCSDQLQNSLCPAIESSCTSKFLIPVFDAWCDRPIDTDEPPDAGIFARLPKPKPPGFPPIAVVAGDRSSTRKFARSATLLSGRAPPGGDAM